MDTGHNAMEGLEGRRLFSFPVTVGSNGSDEVVSVAADDAGNVLMAGQLNGTVDFGGGTQLAGNGAFVAKYAADGTFVWARQFSGATAGKIATDRSGNVYLGGSFSGTVDFDPRRTSNNVTSVGGTDGFVVKLTSTGNLMFVRPVSGKGEEAVTGLAVDRSGVIYVGGTFDGTVSFVSTARVASQEGQLSSDVANAGDGFIASYDVDGTFRWSGSFLGSSAKSLADLALDDAGNVLATGNYVGTVDFNPRSRSTFNAVAGTEQAFVLKWTTAGAFVWMGGLGGTGTTYGTAITADRAGNVYTTGNFSGTSDFDPGAGTVNLMAPASGRVFVSKLDGSGAFFGAVPLGGSTAVDVGPGDIAVDKLQNVYVTGRFSGTQNFNPSGGTSNLTSVGADDVFVTRTNNAGTTLIFDGKMGGPGADAGLGLVLDRSGEVIVGGAFSGTANFATTGAALNETSVGEEDGFIMKLTGAGDPG